MSTMPAATDPVKSDPATWPSWTDDWIWEPTRFPDPDDEAWWAANAPSNVEPDDVDELASLESAALDAIEMGLIPPDLAESISRTSLVGLADELVANYSAEAERVSGSRPTRESAEHAMAINWFRLGHMA